MDLEDKLKCKIKATHPVTYWLVEHAAFIQKHYQIGADGKTPYERHKGKISKHSLCQFGEKIRYMPLKGHAESGKLNLKLQIRRLRTRMLKSNHSQPQKTPPWMLTQVTPQAQSRMHP